jgi:hypothetical protein
MKFTEEGITDPRKNIPWRYLHFNARAWAPKLAAMGAKGIILIADERIGGEWAHATQYLNRPTQHVEGTKSRQLLTGVPIIMLKDDVMDLISTPGQKLEAKLYSESFSFPSVNVVARIKSSDSKLSKEYVLFSGHQDHDGVRNVSGVADSIYIGADDNASGSVALLAIGRAFKKKSGKRSALFVWHGAEEYSLLGSKWYAAHPPVPLSSIVAVLNADMIGMNATDSAALLGSLPPHRNSADLVSN